MSDWVGALNLFSQQWVPIPAKKRKKLKKLHQAASVFVFAKQSEEAKEIKVDQRASDNGAKKGLHNPERLPLCSWLSLQGRAVNNLFFFFTPLDLLSAQPRTPGVPQKMAPRSTAHT